MPKAPTLSLLNESSSNLGGPSTLSQKSRKSKKSWRKNIDISAEESALELAREEERVTGGNYLNKSIGDLFTVDVSGDIACES
jgi:nucleolar protein 53